MSARIAALLLLACTAGACGGTSVNGRDGALSFDLSQATFVNTRLSAAPDSWNTTFLVLSNNGDMCSVISNRTVLQNVEALIVEIGISNEDGSVTFPSVAGTYPIGARFGENAGDKSALVTAVGTGLCTDASSVSYATGGTVHLSHVEIDANGIPQRLVGIIGADFEGGSVDGNFDATLCDPQIETGASFQIFLCGG